MVTKKFTSLRLSDQDLDFLIEAAAPDVGDKSNLKKIIQKDEDFRNSFIEDINVSQISVFLYWEFILIMLSAVIAIRFLAKSGPKFPPEPK